MTSHCRCEPGNSQTRTTALGRGSFRQRSGRSIRLINIAVVIAKDALDHRVFDDIIFPGAGFVELAVAATRGAGVLRDIAFEVPLMVPDPVTVQTVYRGSREEGRIEIFSTVEGQNAWVRNSSATWEAAGEAVGNFAAEVGAENERKARLAVRTAVELELQAKPTTLEEDVELLKRMGASKAGMETEERLAVQFRIEKKKILKETIEKLR